MFSLPSEDRAELVVHFLCNNHRMLRQLERGVHILVATPGRLVDLLERARVSLHMIRVSSPLLLSFYIYSMRES
ncbi:hypothetical protein K7X08_014127 [Anisodus acutangulus]|uniref:Uncharacterized protein n=1 Tax=Anisodus acutangulus TaxID=402998 RepID=A0A9Q1R5W1_9SOLA|nr:hypothetical protein K7X08_014127 [Anisodus acutangulus]